MKNVSTTMMLLSNIVITAIFILTTFFSISTTTNYIRTRISTKNNNNFVQIPLIPHHVQQRRRSLQQQEEEPEGGGFPSLPLYQGKGTHYVDLWIGTPSQRQTLIVDTGSGFTAVPCEGCQDCGGSAPHQFHIDSNFLQTTSSTFRDDISCNECIFGTCNGDASNKCIRIQKYSEGSQITSQEVLDVVSTTPQQEDSNGATSSSFQFHFGCQSQVSREFRSQLADGVMGMDKDHRSSFWKQAYDQNVISNQAFSLCYSGDNHERQESAGVMTLGGTDTTLHETTMVYADQIEPSANQQQSHSYYTVRIKSIYFRSHEGGTSVATEQPPDSSSTIIPIDLDEATLNGGGIILDSGTTETHFPKELEGPFNEAFKTITGGTFGDWFKNKKKITFTPQEYASLPTILIQLQGSNNDGDNAPGLARNMNLDDATTNNDIIVAMPPSHYIVYSKEQQTYASSIAFNDPFYLGILGANFMMGHDVHFDNDQHRIGFSESHCEIQEFNEESSFEKESSSG